MVIMGPMTLLSIYLKNECCLAHGLITKDGYDNFFLSSPMLGCSSGEKN